MVQATTKTKPTEKATKPETKKAKAPVVVDTRKWESTGNYNPKAEHTIKTWEAIEKKLPLTLTQMAAVEHKNPGFVGYLKRREAIKLV